MSIAITIANPFTRGDAAMMIRGCAFPQDRYYHVEYNVWVQRTSEDTVTLGATSFGAALAIEFFAFTPKAIGSVIETGRAVGLLELSKTVVSVRSPVPGTIQAVNTQAMAKPGLISADPYGAGWLARLTTSANLAAQAALLQDEALVAAFEQAMALENFDGIRAG